MGILSAILTLCGCKTKPSTSDPIHPGAVQTMDPRKIYFSIPTLENALPEMEDQVAKDNLQIHEDDWRQMEFVAKTSKPAIDLEIAQIQEVLNHHGHSTPPYRVFDTTHVRSSLVHPLGVSFEEMRSALGAQAAVVHGLSFQNTPGQVRNGISFVAQGIQYYGQLDAQGKVKWLGIQSIEAQNSLTNSVPRLAALLASEKLFLVFWNQAMVLDEANVASRLVPPRPPAKPDSTKGPR